MTAPGPAAGPLARVVGGVDDPVGRAALRRMKLRATGLLAFAGAVFLVTFALPDAGWVGFVQAAAEAGMVGGLADWFAVTALFRHPLGLPIPHTALVPRQKDVLAAKLGEFVTGNFVTPDAVAAQVRAARPVERVARYLADPERARGLARAASVPLAAAVDSLDPRALAEVLFEALHTDLRHRQADGRSWAPRIGELLRTAVEGRGRQPLVDVLVISARDHLREHRADWHDFLMSLGDSMGPILRVLTTRGRVDRVLDYLLRTLDDMIRQGRDHRMRRTLDDGLLRFAEELRTNPDHARAVDEQLLEWVQDPGIQDHLASVVTDLLGSMRGSLSAPDGAFESQVAAVLRKLGQRLQTDPEFTAHANDYLDRAIRWVVGEYGDQLVTLIHSQVQAWDAHDASSRIETAVGKDLQFIRINGTVVGALAGLAIHSVAIGIQHI
jgi:uncharacterized membrane-anchored protein YjiN (DUF445 family)